VKYETSVVYLEQLPKIVVESDFDLATFLSFVVTVVIFAIGTWLTIRNSNKNAIDQRAIFNETTSSQEKALNKTLESQVHVARSIAIKESRQAWINDLRGACSDYIAALGVLQYQIDNKSVYQIFIDKVAKKDASKAAELVASWELEKRRVKQLAVSLKSKIEMLSNPNEKNFQELIVLVNEALIKAETVSGDSGKTCESIIRISQVILKSEWNRAKRME
jgi:hypothetical protein